MATLDEMMQAMSGKPTAASRSREFDHQQFNPNVFGADALKEWLKGVKERTLHPLEALAKYSQDFQKMSPVDQGLQLTGGGLAGTFAGVGAKTANLAKLELAQKLKQQGVPDREIYSKTGWTFGFPDQKARFEIDDSAAKVRDYQLTPQKAYSQARFNAMANDSQELRDRANSMTPYADMTKTQLQDEYSKRGGEIVDAVLSGDKEMAHKLEADRGGLANLMAEMRNAKYGPMSSYLKHGDLGAAYPDVYKIHTRINPDELGMSGGVYKRGAHGVAEQINLAKKPTFADEKSIALHELQHAIQQREGFARGGSPRGAADDVAGELLKINNRIKKIEGSDSLYEGRKAIDKAFDDVINGRITDSQYNQVISNNPIVEEYTRLQSFRRNAPKDGDEAYKRLAGEAEARLTQARMNMTPEQRAASYPLDMFDVPVNEQIVRYDEGNALSLPKTQKEPLFDTSGLPNRGRDLIQSKAEEYAQKMRDSGVNVIDVHHSGSAAGPSSYIKVQGYPDIRISGHSKGVWGTQNVVNVGSDSLFDEVLSKIPKTVRFGSPEEIAAILSKQKEEEIATMYPIRIKSAEKKLAKGKGLTYSEQEAMDWLKNQNIAPKTQYELAHELAQRNAALPVEKGGLGLLANNTAMERAKAIGFDTPAYHGTNQDFDAFNSYGWSTSSPVDASEYANRKTILEGGNGSVLPLMVRNNNPMVINSDRAPLSIIDDATKGGYTGVSGNGFNINNPSDIRSRFAAFDPLKRNSSDLLASLLPITTTGLLANQLRQSLWAEPQPD